MYRDATQLRHKCNVVTTNNAGALLIGSVFLIMVLVFKSRQLKDCHKYIYSVPMLGLSYVYVLCSVYRTFVRFTVPQPLPPCRSDTTEYFYSLEMVAKSTLYLTCDFLWVL